MSAIPDNYLLLLMGASDEQQYVLEGITAVLGSETEPDHLVGCAILDGSLDPDMVRSLFTHPMRMRVTEVIVRPSHVDPNMVDVLLRLRGALEEVLDDLKDTAYEIVDTLELKVADFLTWMQPSEAQLDELKRAVLHSYITLDKLVLMTSLAQFISYDLDIDRDNTIDAD